MQLLQLHRVAHATARPLTRDEIVLEKVRDLILGGIVFVDTFDQDDMPIAARIAATHDYVRDH